MGPSLHPPLRQFVEWKVYTRRNKLLSGTPMPHLHPLAEQGVKKSGTPPPALMEWHRQSAQEERKIPKRNENISTQTLVHNKDIGLYSSA